MRAAWPMVLTAVALIPGAAGAAPAQLSGKSIIVSWSETRVQRGVGEINWRSVNASHSLSVYISSAGRVFSRFSATTRRGSGSNEQVSGGGGSRVPSFSGNSMTIVAPSQGMARRIAVEFGDGFSSCTASVIRGKESGASSGFGTSLITGQRIETQSVTTSGASCSLRAGNVFGGE